MCITQAQKDHVLRVLRIAHEDNDVFIEQNESFNEKEALAVCLTHAEWIDEAIKIVDSLEVK